MKDKIKKIIIGAVVVVIIVGGLFLIFKKDNVGKSPIEIDITELLKDRNLTEDQKTSLNEALESLKQNPENPQAILTVAMIKYQMEDYNGAKDLYYQALEIQPDNTIIYHNLGDIYTLQKDYVNAEKIYLTIITKTPKWLSAYSNLETIYRYHLKEKYPEIEQILLTAIEKTADITEYAPVDLYSMLGSFYKRTNDIPNAIKYYEITLKIMPENEAVQRELEILKSL